MKIYLDLDNTIVDFYGDNKEEALASYKTKEGFFRNLKPIVGNVLFARTLSFLHDVIFISRCPEIRTKEIKVDKTYWLHKYFGATIKVVFVSEGQSKIDAAINSYGDGVLFDDFKKEVDEWNSKSKYGATQVTRTLAEAFCDRFATINKI